MAGRVEGKVAVITGAARGQGRSHAIRLAEEGADIIALDWCQDLATVNYPQSGVEDLAETKRIVEALGRRIVTFQTDVRDRSAVMDAVNAGVSELGHLEIVVGNAGIAPLGRDIPPTAWFDSVQVMLSGVTNAFEASFQHMQAGASMIGIGSVAGLMPGGTDTPSSGPGGGGYSHAKRGVARMVHDLAMHMAPLMIRVNAIHPTNCNTDMLHSPAMYKTFRPDLENPTREQATKAFHALQRMPIPYVEPIDISNVVLFLASDESRYVTGQQIKVDGGGLLAASNSGAPQ